MERVNKNAYVMMELISAESSISRIIARFIIVVGLLFISNTLFSQEESRRVQVKFIDEVITLDGAMDESVWEQADIANNFWQFFPTDSVYARYQTEVRMLYDETNLYVGIYAESSSEKYVVSSLRRDVGGTTNDNVTLIFDTFRDGTNAFFFGVTSYGVQREVQVSEGGASRNGFNPAWDQKWKAEAQRYEDHYIVEIAIPFTSVKFREGADSWRFRAYRWDIGSNEQSTWARVPQNQMLSNLAFMGGYGI